MHAIVRTAYGSPETLRLELQPVPKVGERDVRIRVRASSVNPADLFITRGRPYPLRFAFGWPRPRNPIVGRDLAGVVEEVGPAVTRFRPGDAVFGEVDGAYAESVVAPESALALRPTSISLDDAASLPLAGLTALHAMRDVAKVTQGARVLVNGASGGVGTFAVQIARAMGAEVTGTCSRRNLELVRSIGAHHVVDYEATPLASRTDRYDAILDLVGSTPIARCRAMLTERGVYVSSYGSIPWTLRAFLWSMLPGSKVSVLTSNATPDDLAALARLVDSGAVKPVIERRVRLSEVPAAIARQAAGRARGKTVVLVDPST